MNKTNRSLLSLALILSATALNLSSAWAFNTKYHKVGTSQLEVIDVANEPSEISLKWTTQSEESYLPPTATVLAEDNGFECQVGSKILLFSGYNLQTKTYTQDWEIKVYWKPGADLSGCTIELTHPNTPSSTVYLGMNYHAVNTEDEMALVSNAPRAQMAKAGSPKDDNSSKPAPCAAYGCSDPDSSPRSGSVDSNGPDDVNDGMNNSDRHSGGVFDGGGYNGGSFDGGGYGSGF